MYPIDLLKVRYFPEFHPESANWSKDTNASRKPVSNRHVYRNLQRYDYHIEGGRVSDIVAWPVECCSRSR